MSSTVDKKNVLINFSQQFTYSDRFDAIFNKGMSLTDRASRYLDGEGRKEAKLLKSPLNVIYATESMRLTTRLLNLSSWLLLLNSLKRNEISIQDAIRKRNNIKIKPFGNISHIRYLDDLPKGLQKLIRESYTLNNQIYHIDTGLIIDITNYKNKKNNSRTLKENQKLPEMCFK
ncbi:MAG: hypothetical protein TECD_00061 [Hyphomicrobiaceae bacterium hypho_1]